MITSYNRIQIIKAILSLVGGAVAYALAFLFFKFAFSFLSSAFHLGLSGSGVFALVTAALAVITFSGYREWKRGGGFKGYHESALYHDLGEDTAGAFVVDHYAHKLTGPAYVLSQTFLAGPLLTLRSLTTLRSLIPGDVELEKRLKETLEVLQQAGKWQSLTEYPDRVREVFYLAQMGKIDFSTHKGTPRFRAFNEDGN